MKEKSYLLSCGKCGYKMTRDDIKACKSDRCPKCKGFKLAAFLTTYVDKPVGKKSETKKRVSKKKTEKTKKDNNLRGSEKRSED